jgi:hypothetical protein
MTTVRNTVSLNTKTTGRDTVSLNAIEMQTTVRAVHRLHELVTRDDVLHHNCYVNANTYVNNAHPDCNGILCNDANPGTEGGVCSKSANTACAGSAVVTEDSLDLAVIWKEQLAMKGVAAATGGDANSFSAGVLSNEAVQLLVANRLGLNMAWMLLPSLIQGLR